MKTNALLPVSLLVAVNTFAATALHHYTFDGLGVTDSVGSAHGILQGGAGTSLGMLVLDGTNDYVQFAEKLIPGGNFSLAFFAQELSPTSDRAEVISQGYMFGPGFYFGYYGGERSLRVGDQWQSTGYRFPADGLLHHYAITTDPTGARLYMDGLCVGTNGPIEVTMDGTNTRLGRQYDPWSEFFHGSLDELWVFTGALTAEEVAQLAAAKPLGPNFSIEVSEVRLCWQTQTNITYQVQYRSDLTTNQWLNLSAPIAGTGTTSCMTDPVTGPQRFYRVVTLP